MRRRLCAAVLATTALVPAGASAAVPQVHAKRMVIAFDVHVLHVTDWRLWTVPASATEPSWTHASGTQTLGYASKRPIVADVSSYAASSPSLQLPPLVIAPRHVPKARLTAQRRVSWVEHQESLCDREGGCGGQGRFVREWHPRSSCPTRRLASTVAFDLGVRKGGDRDLAVSVGDPPVPLWTACAPDGGERRLGTLRTGTPRRLLLGGNAVRRVQRLRRHRTTTLKASYDAGWDGAKRMLRCPVELTGNGRFQECSVTDVIVKAHRLR